MNVYMLIICRIRYNTAHTGKRESGNPAISIVVSKIKYMNPNNVIAIDTILAPINTGFETRSNNNKAKMAGGKNVVIVNRVVVLLFETIIL